jgi:hypothetical protein
MPWCLSLTVPWLGCCGMVGVRCCGGWCGCGLIERMATAMHAVYVCMAGAVPLGCAIAKITLCCRTPCVHAVHCTAAYVTSQCCLLECTESWSKMAHHEVVSSGWSYIVPVCHGVWVMHVAGYPSPAWDHVGPTSEG